jgi:hypothetical protein
MGKMPKDCKTCTQFLNDNLPDEECYIHCPKYDRMPIKVESATDLKTCPKCNQATLFWNYLEKKFECMNLKCKATYTEPELRSIIWERNRPTVKPYKTKYKPIDHDYLGDGGWVEHKGDD